jgi:hypothetical protein
MLSVLSTPLVAVLVLCIVVLHQLVPPVVQFDVVCACDQLDCVQCICANHALAVVSLVCVVVHHHLVLPVVHV